MLHDCATHSNRERAYAPLWGDPAVSAVLRLRTKWRIPLADEKHPYASPGAITGAVNQFRKTFPAAVNADTLRKLSIAPQNESYVINTLRYIGVIDGEGNKTPKATSAFNRHEHTEFQNDFGAMVRAPTRNCWEFMGTHLGKAFNKLIAFFRNADQTSDVVGRRQASTFQALAALPGHGEVPAPPKPKLSSSKTKTEKMEISKTAAGGQPWHWSTIWQRHATARRWFDRSCGGEPSASRRPRDYDRIFRSIRENLLNAK